YRRRFSHAETGFALQPVPCLVSHRFQALHIFVAKPRKVSRPVNAPGDPIAGLGQSRVTLCHILTTLHWISVWSERGSPERRRDLQRILNELQMSAVHRRNELESSMGNAVQMPGLLQPRQSPLP